MNPKHEREKEVRQQRAEEGKHREEEVAACYSPASSSSRTADETTLAERLRLVAGMVRPALPCGRGVALSAALTYEDALVDGGAKRIEYWTYKRRMGESFRGGRLIVAYHTLPLMRADRQLVGWDNGDDPGP